MTTRLMRYECSVRPGPFRTKTLFEVQPLQTGHACSIFSQHIEVKFLADLLL